MIWRRPVPPRPRPARHGRHGRLGRSAVVPPPLPPLDSRLDRFDLIVGDTAEYLRDLWPELRDVTFERGFMPAASDDDGIPRWSVDKNARRIVIHRLPLERLDRAIGADELSVRITIESAVFGAAGEYLDRDPWDLAPERHRRG